MTRTDDIIAKNDLIELMSLEPDDPVPTIIGTHDGEWRKEEGEDKWRFFEHPDLFE